MFNTGVMEGTIHRAVTDKYRVEIHVGAVLILQQVRVWSIFLQYCLVALLA